MVHFAVVLLLVGALALLAMFFLPKLRNHYLPVATIITVLGVLAAIAAKLTGDSLANQVGRPTWHENLGNATVLVGLLLSVSNVVWLVVDRRAREATERAAANQSQVPVLGRIGTVAAFATAILAVAVLVLTALTGHAGASETWTPRMEQVSPSPSPTASVPSRPQPTRTAPTEPSTTIEDPSPSADPSESPTS